MRKSSIGILLLLMTATGSLLAQTGARNKRATIFNLPPSVPVPCWVTRCDWEHPNVHTIDSTIEACEKNEVHAKTEEEEENDEEPYRVAYTRWRGRIAPFIQANGTVVEDPGYYNRLLSTAINAQGKKNARVAAAAATANGNWTILGPVETYNEGKNKIPLQVNIYSFAIAPSNQNIVYAGAETGAIYRSADKGLHWASISDNLPPFTATSMVVDPTNANTVYAVSYDGQLIKTINAGASWTFLTGYQGGTSEKITISKTTGTILVAGQSGVYFSNNGGSSWQLAGGSSADRVYDVEFNAVNPNIVYAAGTKPNGTNSFTIFRSVNGGATFTAVNAPAFNNVHCFGARLGVTPANGNTVYCINLNDSLPELFKSTDGGISWNITATGKSTALDMDNWQGFYDLDLMVSPTNENQLITGSWYALKSVDGGFNFTRLSDMPFHLHADIQCMRSAGNDAWITTDGGVNYSTDFFTSVSNYSVRNNGLTGSEFWGFGQGWDQDIVVGGRYHNGDVALFENYGPGNSLYTGGAEAATGHVFHGQKNMVGFNDEGTKQLPSALPGNIIYSEYANTLWPQDDWYGTLSSKLMIDPRYSNTFYVGRDNMLWKSSNRGVSYSALNDFGSRVWRFDIARSNPDIMYVCAENGLYKTTDGGASWATLSLPSDVAYSFYNADIAVDQLNENVVFLCMAQGDAGKKIFKSTDGGSTWINYTSSLTNAPIAFITPQAGTNGGVYAFSNNAPAKVYYRDNTMTDWVDYSNGLPLNFAISQGGIIFYRDSKLRIAGNRGVWESPLYGAGTPVAQPMADKQFISCTRDTVLFTDYSNINYAGAQWKWNFPGVSYVSSTTAREPKVLYQVPGSYTVSLEVTDAAGNKHTRTVNQMITFTRNNCSPDTVAGQCLKMDGSYNSINLGKVNINSNNFSISCWIKPDGLQNALTQLLAHDAYPGSSSWFGLGFPWQGGSPNAELAYTDNLVSWGNTSGLIADTTGWNFVVLTYSPTGVKIYLNGVPATVNNGQMPVIDLSQSPFYISRDIHGQGAAYHGNIDEIKFYNYALTQNEVREKMHLIQSNAATETGLLKYYQFNQYDSTTGVVQDIAGSYAALVPANLIVPSTAPVATGKVFRKSTVNSGGQHSFTGTGIDLFLKNGATYPNGEVVAFQLNSPPDRKPDSLSLVPRSGYFIINNYGSNKTFTAPDSIRFNGKDLDAAYRAGDFRMYSRPSGAWGDKWGAQKSRSTRFNYLPGNSTITFGAGNNVTGFGQFALSAPAVIADTVAGKCLKMDGSMTAISLGNVNINSNNFSISCWIKPDGLQKTFSQIVGWNPKPELGKGFGLGFRYNGFAPYAPNLELCYTDTIVGWSNSSGLIADTATWNFVVLTYSPTGVTIYLNGMPATVNNGPMPVLNLSQDPFYVNLDIHDQNGAYKGAVDEIKFYNYALSQNEIREKMHLIQSNAGAENGLLKYFQFNQYNSATGTVPDIMSNFKATIPGSAFITASTAPVATGSVFRKSNVNAGGKHSFTGTGIDLFLKNNATYPNGEVVAFQLNSPPDTKPNSLPLVPGSHYFIINNYGSNKTFTVPDSIRFSGLNIANSNFKATDFKIYKRASNAWGATWSTDVRQSVGFAYAAGNSTITFNNQSNVTSFGQFAISAPTAARLALAVDTPVNASPTINVEFYPNPNSGWGYLNITSPHENAHVNLYLQNINGNIVYQASEQLNSGNKSTFMLNLSALPSGIYIMQIRFSTGELITKKVTIVK